MFCKFCGKNIAKESKFCRYCGENVSHIRLHSELKLDEADYHTESLASRVSKTTIEIIVTILIFFNFSSGIVGAIWLALLGGWRLVLYGIILSILMPFFYTIVFLPQMALSYPLIKFEEKGNKFLVAILGFIISAYGNFILSIWLIFVFGSLVRGQAYSIFPLLLWGYSTTMAPLSYMASKEPPDSVGTSLGLLFAQLGYVLLIILFFIGSTSLTRNIALGLLILLFSSVTIPTVLRYMEAKRTQ